MNEYQSVWLKCIVCKCSFFFNETIPLINIVYLFNHHCSMCSFICACVFLLLSPPAAVLSLTLVAYHCRCPPSGYRYLLELLAKLWCPHASLPLPFGASYCPMLPTVGLPLPYRVSYHPLMPIIDLSLPFEASCHPKASCQSLGLCYFPLPSCVWRVGREGWQKGRGVSNKKVVGSESSKKTHACN